ncbi:MAG TPA: DUF4976 domain-containing protein [Verrucomicrobiales bacterium]|nr:DUF4976 domain-containing protein [Verrucomicrobiales bacterium]
MIPRFLPASLVSAAFALFSLNPGYADDLHLAEIHDGKKRNIIFILCDDHRADALGFTGHPFLETPSLDRMAQGGVYLRNAYVTTSLCSPSRASILTGLYTHNHRVTDNYHPVGDHLKFFPQYLQKAGYETAFFGKWHMGDEDKPQRGFDHWAAFRGQGTYWPDGHGTTRVVPQTRYDGFNVNGKQRPQKDYITDELTDMTLKWLKNRRSTKPYFAYISHKGVHSDFVPHDRHRGKYKDEPWSPPSTFEDSAENRRGKPMWAINQRNSRHGTDYGYNLQSFDVEGYYKRYCEALLAVDDSVGRVIDYLKEVGELESTMLVYMGDNGFSFGEHGLIDKRTAYETSIRVPLLVHCPELFRQGSRIDQVIANIDIGPTLLEAAGLTKPVHMDGKSFYPLMQGKKVSWREGLLYEYFWEWNYPQTPTIHAVIGQRYKYIRYHGIWDTNELYDMEQDPNEQNNLIWDPAHKELIHTMKERLFQLLDQSGGHSMALLPDRGRQFYHRHPERSGNAEFPPQFFLTMPPVTK